MQRGFGTEVRPKKGSLLVKEAVERLITHGFFQSGQVSKASWKKVFPAFSFHITLMS